MAVYTISDLHLSNAADKPMDIFSSKWNNHTEKLFKNWNSLVTADDYVVIPGDISWGTHFDDAVSDLKFIDSLNGKKLIGRGNHDFWWTTLTKLKRLTNELNLKTIVFLYNNAYKCDNIIVCGTRGWTLDSDGAENQKMIRRETIRLRISLEAAKKLNTDDSEIVVFLHYPPTYNGITCTQFADLMNEYNVKRCYYGHLHGITETSRLADNCNGIRLFLTSADYLNFKPIKINGGFNL